MALINCPECGAEVSDKAAQCPKCAYPIAADSGEAQEGAPKQMPPDAETPIEAAPTEPQRAAVKGAMPEELAKSTTECPFCRAEIPSTAKRCKFCREVVDPTLRAAQPSVYVPAVPPKKFLAGNALASLLLVCLGAWLLFVKIPQHDPEALGFTGVVGSAITDRAVLKPEAVTAAKGGAIFLGVLGLVSLLGSFRETGRLLMCRKCGIQVVARRKILGRFACERCGLVLQGKIRAAVTLTVMVAMLAAMGITAAVALAAVASDAHARDQAAERAAAERQRAEEERKRAEAQRQAWLRNAQKSMRGLLARAGMPRIVATSILNVTHPSGGSPTLQESEVSILGDTLVTDLTVSWKGGILGTNYTISVRWRCTQAGPVGLEVLADDSPISPTRSATARLEEWFRTQIWVELK